MQTVVPSHGPAKAGHYVLVENSGDCWRSSSVFSRGRDVGGWDRAGYTRPMKPLVTAGTRRPASALATSPAPAGSMSASGFR